MSLKQFIHIGLPKCGSTFLQTTIFWNFTRTYSLEYRWLRNREVEQFLKTDLYYNNNIFITNEHLIWDNNLKKIEKKISILKNYNNFEAILIIRNPVNFFKSHYQHILTNRYLEKNNKKRHTNFEEFYEKFFELEKFSYIHLFNLLKNNFIKVHVLKIENLNHTFQENNFLGLKKNYLNSIKKTGKINQTVDYRNFHVYRIIFKIINIKKIDKLISTILTFLLKKIRIKDAKIKSKIIYNKKLENLLILIVESIFSKKKSKDKLKEYLSIKLKRAINEYNNLDNYFTL